MPAVTSDGRVIVHTLKELQGRLSILKRVQWKSRLMA